MTNTKFTSVFFKINLHLFDTVPASSAGVYQSNGHIVNATHNTPETSGNDLTPQQRIFYSKALLENARPNLVHNQFGEQHTVPAGNGKVIQFNGQNPYPAATTPLEEGITPAPNLIDYRKITAELNQYGAYTPTTDLVNIISMNDIAMSDTKELSDQAGRTIDIITRDVINAGTNKLLAPIINADGTTSAVTSRASITKNCLFTTDLIFKAAAVLKGQNAGTIDGSYVGIIHPDVEYDIIHSKGFIDIVKYNDSTRLFEGEIGKIGKVRFVVSSESKVFEGAGAEGIDVYSTLIIGAKAYATIKLEGGNLEHIVKPLGSGGTADPLNQRATRGWKVTHTAAILAEQNMVRVESASSLYA